MTAEERNDGSMCGRYYIDDETEQAVFMLTAEMDRDRSALRFGGYRSDIYESVTDKPIADKPVTDKPGPCPSGIWKSGDVAPHDAAPVLLAKNGRLVVERQQWGFPGAAGKGLIINARAETALDKRLFRDAVLSRRAVIPASKFYEWNRNRDRITFLREDSEILFMAGFYSRFEDGNHYVILTTEANESMKQTHDRMPLLLERDEVASWVLDGTKTEGFLRQKPALLGKEAEYEQISFAGL